MNYQLHLGDCLETLRGMADNSVDSIVTDPPYGLAFMGKKWDYDVPKVEVWAECLRVLKPGGHLLAFAGTRTQHRMAVRIEDAGFEIRDMIAWVYGSGFPKSLDLSKAIDKAAGAEREVVGPNPNGRPNMVGVGASVLSARVDAPITDPATEAARQWQGWGTALKPALEPVTVARKPLAGTVAANVLHWGTGGLNIDACRIGTDSTKRTNGVSAIWAGGGMNSEQGGSDAGRWPANLIHDGSDDVLTGFPDTETVGRFPALAGQWGANGIYGKGTGVLQTERAMDTGSAARFFYCAKASKDDRDDGCIALPLNPGGSNAKGYTQDVANGLDRETSRANHHPTVKPTDLMRYLVRLVTPPGGTVLDPFNGSGSTGKACMLEGFAYIGCELDPAYIEISRARIEYAIALRASGADKLQPASERDDKTIDLFSGATE